MERDRWCMAEFGDKLSWSRRPPIPVTDVYPAIVDNVPMPMLHVDPFMFPTDDAPIEPYPMEEPVMQLPAIAFIDEDAILPPMLMPLLTALPYPLTPPPETDCGETDVIPETTIPIAFIA